MKTDDINIIREETDQAIETSLDHAHEEWRRVTLQNLKKFCEFTPMFTMNDFREYNAEVSDVKTYPHISSFPYTLLQLQGI